MNSEQTSRESERRSLRQMPAKKKVYPALGKTKRFQQGLAVVTGTGTVMVAAVGSAELYTAPRGFAEDKRCSGFVSSFSHRYRSRRRSGAGPGLAVHLEPYPSPPPLWQVTLLPTAATIAFNGAARPDPLDGARPSPPVGCFPLSCRGGAAGDQTARTASPYLSGRTPAHDLEHHLHHPRRLTHGRYFPPPHRCQGHR